jgi:maleamate amidohydrolase
MSEENLAALEADYAASGFGGRLPFGDRPALLIVDVCNAYIDPDSPLYAHGEAVLASNVRLANAARMAGVPIFFTRVAYSANGLDGGLFYRKVPALKAYLPGNALGDFHKDLRPMPDDIVVTKQYASAFFGSSLAATLTAMSIDSLLITGFSTSGCVRASALDALQHGFIPYVIADACGDRDDRPHQASLFDLQNKYAEVVDEKQALALIGKSLPDR